MFGKKKFRSTSNRDFLMEQPYLGFYCRKKLILFFTPPDTEFYPLHENYNNFQLFKTPGTKKPI